MNLQTFDFNEAPVRVMLRDEEPWFVAADVCRVLDLSNPTMACDGLDEDERMTLSNTEGHSGQRGGAQSFNVISESGLYALIFKSRKPEARKFRKWVTAEVLPALRKTGRYAIAPGDEGAECLSLLRFVRETMHGWTLERQMEFGMQARRFAKSMGVIFQTGHEPGVGRVFVFPRAVLETVRLSFQRTSLLPDSDAVEFERLLEALHRGEGDAFYRPDVARGMARTMGLFPRIFGDNTSVESERSSFGCLCKRFNGSIFPSGLMLRMRGHSGNRRYEILRTAPELALTS